MEEKKTIKLSVIIPAYNSGVHLTECLDSVLSQLPGNCELIVIDDGSEDSTSKILAEYKKNNENLLSARIDHKGTSAARNKGLSLARGEYVAFLDSDDCMKDMFLEKSLPLLEKQALLYIFGIERTYLSGGSESWTVENMEYDSVSDFADTYIRKRHLLIYSNCNKFYQRRIIEKSDLRFDETVDFGEDRLFNYGYLNLLADEPSKTCSSDPDLNKAVITSGLLMIRYIQRDNNSMSGRHIPYYFKSVMKLHEIKMQCFLHLSKNTSEEERLDFEEYDISREIEKTIDRFTTHPEEREENMPEINRLISDGTYDANTKTVDLRKGQYGR